MRILTAVALLLAVTAAGADDVRVQVNATILSRCEPSSSHFDTRSGPVRASVARCTGAGETVPYRVRYDDTVSTAHLPRDPPVLIGTPHPGQMLPIEF